jgi:long-chain acyl-CoA synthetase
MGIPAGLSTYTRRFEEVANQSPDRIAIRHKTPSGYREITFSDLHAQVRGVALALIHQGLQRRARIAVLSENRPEWAVAYLGILMAGGIVVPLDPQISPDEWRRLLDDSEAAVIFVSGLLLPKLRQAVRDSLLGENIICFDPPDPETGACRMLDALVTSGLAAAPPPRLPAGEISDPAVIIYTSGTTGKPKGVMLTQENIVSVITACLAIVDLGARDVFLCLLPLHHVFASVVSMLVPLYLGAQIVFADTLKRAEILAALQEAKISILATVPLFFYLFHGRIEEELVRKGLLARKLFRAMLGLNRICLRHLHINLGRLLFGNVHRTFGASLRLFVSGGSPFDPKVARDFHDLGFTILQGYGLTETTGPCAVTRIEDNVIGSVGSALPGVEIRILEPDLDGIGEVAIRGPIVMKGYYMDSEGTAKVMRDGWFLSGDLGWLDERGILFITGRRKEVIVLPNGKNIYPDELEAHYEKCPYIEEIAVLGIAGPDRQGAERLHAVVVPDFDALKAGKIANAREALQDEIARLSHQLPHYKRLLSYQVQKESLPRTTTHKIKRLELKALIESGALLDSVGGRAPEPASDEERELQESAAGQAVLSCLRDTYHRAQPLGLGLNLELDLGFDSMERVELLANLEHALGLELPEDFGAEIYTVRDLIRGLQQRVTGSSGGSAGVRQNWAQILSAESLARDKELTVRFAGSAVACVRWVGVRFLHLLFTVFFRFEAQGLENLPREGPFLLCPNHLSYLDPLMVLAPLPRQLLNRIFFVGASFFLASRFMKLVARLADIFPVDPDVHLLRAMKAGAHGLRSGRVLCIFPEGARSFDGRLAEFKKGAAILAREIGVPMIPVAICGTYEVWPRDSWRFRLHKVRIVFGSPLAAASAGEMSPYEADTIRLRAAVARLIADREAAHDLPAGAR